MSRSRQVREPDVRTASVVFTTRNTWRDRRNRWGQLIFTPKGLLTVHTPEGLWVLSPQQALWAPPGLVHDVEAAPGAPLRTFYLTPALCAGLPDGFRVVQITPLLRELMRSMWALEALDRAEPAQANLIAVFLDQLRERPIPPIDLVMPRDPRALRAATLVRGGARASLAEVSRAAGASPRTLERLFREETGLPFGAWRQRAGFLAGLEALAADGSVTAAAAAAGYESTSAFVAAFRRALGVTPGRWFRPGPAPAQARAARGL